MIPDTLTILVPQLQASDLKLIHECPLAHMSPAGHSSRTEVSEPGQKQIPHSAQAVLLRRGSVHVWKEGKREKGEYSKVHGWDCSSCNAGIPRLNKEVYPNIFQMLEARSQVWMLTAVLSPSIVLAVGISQEWFLAAGTGYITPLALFSHFSTPVIIQPVKSNLLRSDSIIFLWACNMFFC